MKLKDLYEKAVKQQDWSMIRQTIATTLIFSLLGTQMPLSSAAGIGGQETGNSGSQTESNAAPLKRDTSDDGDVDEGEGNIISGTITIMDDGMQSQSAFNHLDLRLYVNGVLATGSNCTVKLDKSGSIIASGSNAVIPLENDLEDADNSSRGNGAPDGFRVWSWYVEGLPECDEEGVPYTYSIRDMMYHPATASNTDPIDGYALFYTDEDGKVADTDGEWGIAAWNLVYVQKGTVQGDFMEETGAIPLASPANLIPKPYASEDSEYIGEAYGWIDTGAGSWCIADALMFNPETSEEIIWCGQVDEAALGNSLIRYENIEAYKDFDDNEHIFNEGTIVNCTTTCQVTGTISWMDGEDTYGKRPAMEDFTLQVMDEAGELVQDAVVTIAEGYAPGTWKYTIQGLSVNGTYKVKAVVPTGYIEAAEIEFMAVAGEELGAITMQVSTPGSVNIKAEVEGLKPSEQVTLYYTLLVGDGGDEEEYTGRYSIIYADGRTTGGTGSRISVNAGETVEVQLIDTVEETGVAVTPIVNPEVLYIDYTFNEDENLYVFRYSALSSVEVCIVWNDNNNYDGERPYLNDKESYLAAGHLELYFSLDGGITYQSAEAGYGNLNLEQSPGFGILPPAADSSDWYFIVDGLPAYGYVDGQWIEVLYQVRVADEAEEPGYIISEPVFTETANREYWKIFYTKELLFKATVQWYDDEENNHVRPGLDSWNDKLTVYQIGQDGIPVLVEASGFIPEIVVEQDETDESKWNLIIYGLPEYDEDGHPYVYYVMQAVVSPEEDGKTLLNQELDLSYVTEYDNTGNFTGKTEGCYQGGTIVNVLQGTLEFSMTKVWNDGNSPDRPNVTLVLWRYIKGEADYFAAAKVDLDQEPTIDNTESIYQVVIPDLPLFDSDGHEYIYFIKEEMSSPGDYIQEVTNVVPFDEVRGADLLVFNGGTLSNKLSGKETISGKKIWKAKSVQGMKATVTVELQRREKGSADEWETVDEDSKYFRAEVMSQEFTFTADKYSAEGVQYEYRVVETGVSITYPDGTSEDIAIDSYDEEPFFYTVGDYEFECTEEDGTIINRLVGETAIEINKHWDPDSGNIDELHFHVFRNGEEECVCNELVAEGETLEPATGKYDHWGVLVMTNNDVDPANDKQWHHLFEGLPKYDDDGAMYSYTISEDIPEGYECLLEFSFDTSDAAGYKHLIATVHNGPGPGKRIKVTKTWLDDSDLLRRDAVTIGLFKNNQDTGKTLELSADNVWWDYFILDSNADYSDYTVKEIKIGEEAERQGSDEDPYFVTDYHTYKVVEQDVNGNGTEWKIINQRVASIDIDLNKTWAAGGEEADFSAVFEVLQNGVSMNPEQTATLTRDSLSGEFHTIFKNLPKYDSKGKLYEYTLIETKANGVDVISKRFTHNGITYQTSLDPTGVVWADDDDYEGNDTYSWAAANRRIGISNIVFHKIWKDDLGGSKASRPGIYLKLYRSTDINPGGDLVEQLATWEWEVGNDYHQIITYKNLPKYDPDGYPYVYYAEERVPASGNGGWQKAYFDELPTASGAYIGGYSNLIPIPAEGENENTTMPAGGIVVNYRTGETSVSGRKIWENMGVLNKNDYPQIKMWLMASLWDPNTGSYGDALPVPDGAGGYRFAMIKAEGNDYVSTYSFEGLPRYDDITGAKITYTVSEELLTEGVENFRVNNTDFGFKNTYNEDKHLSIEVEKVWDWGSLGSRPDHFSGYPSVTFNLWRVIQKLEGNDYVDAGYAAVKVGSKTLPATTNNAEQVSVTFADLPYYAPNGRPYRYYVTEAAPGGYTSSASGVTGVNIELSVPGQDGKVTGTCTVENTYNDEVVKIKGTKTWSGDSEWGIRPDFDSGITLTLWRRLSNQTGDTGSPVEAELKWLTDSNNKWTYEFFETSQPFYCYATTGVEYTYYVKEEPVPGYKAPSPFYNYNTKTVENGSTVFNVNITNTLNTKELKVEKKWVDNNNRYSTRPASITVKLQRKIAGSDDSEFKDVIYPATSGSKYTKTLTESSWAATFSGLPMYAVTDGKADEEYTYRAVEINADGVVGPADEGYTSASETKSGTTTITNTLKFGNLSVEKVWDDSGNQDGIRPEKVVVHLYKTTDPEESGSQVSENGNVNFTLSENSSWRYTWSGLPTHSPAGKEYYYYVVEEGTGAEPLVRYAVTYSSAISNNGTWQTDKGPQKDPVTVIPAAEDGAETWLIITNAYTPKKMSISVEKKWVGGDGVTPLENKEILPETITWQLQSRFENEKTWEDNGTSWVTGPGQDDTYPAAWENLPIKGKDASGTSKLIEYRVEEITVPGYKTSYSNGTSGVSGDITKTEEANQQTVTVTNRLTATTQVEVTKIWDDSVPGYNRNDEIATIIFKLQRKLAGSEDDFADVIQADGSAVEKSVLVLGSDTISCDFKVLPRYDMAGNEYEYRAVEAGFILTPKDGSGSEYVLPESQDGLSGTIGGYTFESVYIKAEDNGFADTASGSKVTITNTLLRRNVTVKKMWEDNGNQDGVRPTGVVVELLYDGVSYVPAKTATLSNATEWNYEWDNLPASHADGTAFEYSVAEIEMQGVDESRWGTNNGYETSYSEVSTAQSQALTVTNSRLPETIEYKVYKYWEDSNEYDWSAERPDSIQVQLYRQVNQGTVTVVENGLVTLYAEDRDGHDAWTYTWTGLPKYARVGEVETEIGASYEIQYSVKEVIPADGSGYEAAIDGNQITNQLRTTELTVTKEWEDQNNYYGLRPQTITIQLQRSVDGTSWKDVEGVFQELDVHDSTPTCIFIGLPIRDKDNNSWQYRAVESHMEDVKVTGNAASGYKVTYEHEPNAETDSGESEPGETVITNTLETVELSGKKTWEDQGNHYGTRPQDVKLTLKSRPEGALAKELLEALVPEWSKNGNIWTYTYTGLPKYMADGKTTIIYSVEETVDAVYEVSYDAAHTNLKNTMKTGALAVTKIQEGGVTTNFTFRVKLSINGVETLYTGPYTVLGREETWNAPGEVRQADVTGAIVIHKNQQFVITGLPAGAAYIVTEAPVNHFTLVSTVADTGVIPHQDAAITSFTNKYTGGGGGDNGSGTTPTQPVTEAPTEPGTEGTVPTTPETSPAPDDDGLVEIPGNPPSIIIEDPNGDTIYEGPTDNGYVDTNGWPPGTYTIYLLDDEGVPLGQMLVTIPDNDTPLADLAKTGDNSLPYALLIVIMLGAVGSITVLVIKRRKEE